MPADPLCSLFVRQLPLDHIRRKKPREFSNGNHMELQHQFDALHGCFAVWVEEEDSGVIDKDIHYESLLDAPVVQGLCGVVKTQVGKTGDSFDVVLFRQISSNLVEFLLLIADQDKVTMIVTSQLCGVLQAYTAACAGNERQ